ncbi:CotY/CotZ family spore coat protein [Bacillus sp. SM2101]|uniref:CotY/CotZ family spore coat protein n=1 Tax=Bacillaceae TaxID=186817 RepID=UPI001BDEEEF7|nr:CotY/CotZ family spore coat protein [Bacillus sp. SM2101]
MPCCCPNGDTGNGGNIRNCVCTVLEDNINQDVILTTNSNTIFYAFGNIRESSTGQGNCFVTVYFRVSEVDLESGCVTLQLLQPEGNREINVGNQCCIRLNQICQNDELDLTPIDDTVVVDCSCLCSVQIIPPL